MTLVSAAVLFFVAIGGGAIVTFDRLVRREHRLHYSSWVNDGRPEGFFWYPFEESSFWARQKLSIIWLFKTSAWMRQDEQALALVDLYRALIVISHVGAMVTLVAYLVLE